MTIQELEVRLEDLSWNEQGHLFRRLALDLTHEWPGIEKTPGVQGGDACIVRTRIPVLDTGGLSLARLRLCTDSWQLSNPATGRSHPGLVLRRCKPGRD